MQVIKSRHRGKPGACWSCGVKGHKRADCKYQLNSYKCNECGKAGHKTTMCPRRNRSTRGSGPAQQHQAQDHREHATAADEDSDSVTIHTVHVPANRVSLYNNCCAQVNTVQSKQFDVTATINCVPVRLALETCAVASIATSSLRHRFGQMLSSPLKLHAYGGGEVPALGQCDVEIEYEGQRRKLPLIFVEFPNKRGLFGLPWINAFKAVTVNNVDTNTSLTAMLNEFNDVFEPLTGLMKGHVGHLYLKPDAVFKMNKLRPVPYAYRPQVKVKLERLVKQGVLTPDDVAEYTTTPLVIVPKPNSCVRVC